MSDATVQEVSAGLRFGVVAGVIFGAAESAAATAMGDAPAMPVRMFASVALGARALEGPLQGSIVAVGIAAHLVLSALFGVVYGLASARLSVLTQTDWARQMALRAAFGAVLWFVNFQIIARAAYPWFLGAPQVLQLVMHAVFFGVPLSLLFARARRGAHHVMTTRPP